MTGEYLKCKAVAKTLVYPHITNGETLNAIALLNTKNTLFSRPKKVCFWSLFSVEKAGNATNKDIDFTINFGHSQS